MRIKGQGNIRAQQDRECSCQGRRIGQYAITVTHMDRTAGWNQETRVGNSASLAADVACKQVQCQPDWTANPTSSPIAISQPINFEDVKNTRGCVRSKEF
ncbi:hypothetical protein PoB_002695500 [Plakobranchus ocellatus]|uniref:Uncharacterized protein n=1 Tax=Plakobranchus ocellatus TaxID=259542 RepID=A0AAV4A0K7_9GAST|nr:hypothetical protein PoB_002695500 [Plakobranchus ocellatus]